MGSGLFTKQAAKIKAKKLQSAYYSSLREILQLQQSPFVVPQFSNRVTHACLEDSKFIMPYETIRWTPNNFVVSNSTTGSF